jgi:glycosyltransferase involved in cell wall biosynthesis
MDGGSTDGTAEILKKYGSQLTWFSEEDRGQSDALNKGFCMATGDICAYLNSDDVYEPGALFKAEKFFADHPQADWVTGRCQLIDPQGRKFRKIVCTYKNFWLLFKSYTVLLVLDYISQPATFWSRQVIEKVGLFDERLHFSMDYDYSLRVGQHFKLWVINDYLAAFRIHPASKSGQIRDHFNTDLSIAKRYSRSRLLINLHSFHNSLIVAAYQYMQSANS